MSMFCTDRKHQRESPVSTVIVPAVHLSRGPRMRQPDIGAIASNSHRVSRSMVRARRAQPEPLSYRVSCHIAAVSTGGTAQDWQNAVQMLKLMLASASLRVQPDLSLCNDK